MQKSEFGNRSSNEVSSKQNLFFMMFLRHQHFLAALVLAESKVVRESLPEFGFS